METIRLKLQAKKLSKDALKFALKAKRSSTKYNYDNKWKSWVTYCESQTIDPLKPEPTELANFLAYLYTSKGSKVATLKNYRSAITNTIRAATGRTTDSLSKSPLIKDVLEGIKSEYPSKGIQTANWDLFLVLQSLLGSPYEPLETASLKHLTHKTVFLVALACARRVSGINAINGNDVEFTPDLSSMTLSFLPEFRAKNQELDSDTQCFEVKSLSTLTDRTDKDYLLCPVRALSIYLKRTAPHRKSKRKLFISFNPNYEKDIGCNSIARWLKSCIIEAYKMKSQTLSLNMIQAHDLRRLSTSLGAAKGVSLAHLMKTAFWKSPNVFTSHYLRDIAVKKVNQTYGLARLIVANSILHFQ
jgi:hypothetical protein